MSCSKGCADVLTKLFTNFFEVGRTSRSRISLIFPMPDTAGFLARCVATGVALLAGKPLLRELANHADAVHSPTLHIWRGKETELRVAPISELTANPRTLLVQSYARPSSVYEPLRHGQGNVSRLSSTEHSNNILSGETASKHLCTIPCQQGCRSKSPKPLCSLARGNNSSSTALLAYVE